MHFNFIQKLLRSFVLNKHATLKKYINLIHILYQHTFTKPSKVSGYPIRLIIDPCNHCDLKCPLCPTGQQRKERTRALMPVDDFEKIINPVADYLFEIDLYCWGEPLLHKQIGTLIQKAKQKNIRVTLSSHMNHATPAVLESLVDNQLDQITVSIDGYTQEIYEQYRKGGNIERVFEHVLQLQSLKRQKKSKKPKIVWQFLMMSHNEHEINLAKKNYRQKGFDALELRAMRSDMGKELEHSIEERRQNAKKFLPSIQRYQRYTSTQDTMAAKQCLFLWTQAVVHPDLSVTPCCAMYDNQHNVGSLKTHSFLDVWNNETYQARRLQVKNKQCANNACDTCIRYGFVGY